MTAIKTKISKRLSLLFVWLFWLPNISYAHNGSDPVKELEKKRRYLGQYQQEFTVTNTDVDRIRILRKQISNLQGTVLLLRNTLVKERKIIREQVSKQKIDYLLAMKSSLKEMETTLLQFEEMMEE